MIRATVSQSDLTKMKNHIIKNVRWGTVVAITRTVNKVRDEAKILVKSVYTVRNQWVPGSIMSTTATKETMSGTVGTIQRFLLEHERGGQRHSVNINRTEGIPEYARENPAATTTKSKWPSALMARNRRGPEVFGPKEQFKRNKSIPVYGPVNKTGYLKHSKGGTGVKGRFYGSKSRHGGRYFYLRVMGRKGPLHLLIQRMSKSGKGTKNRVWYVIAEGGTVNLDHNLMWESLVARVTKVFSENITVELTKALSHGRTLP